jgi:hypothetical protein
MRKAGSRAKRVSRKLAPVALLAAALYAAGARGDDSGTPKLSFGGFGTVGVVHSSEKNADFVSSSIKPNGAGYSHDWSADVDSRIGAQLTATLTPRLSAVLQVISEQNYDDTYRPYVEWANIKYQIAPDFSIRAGRIVLPVFLVSDYRKVGYANPWVRPPVEVYDLVPISSSDGVDASYRVRVGEFTNTVQGAYGQGEAKFPGYGGSTAKAKDAWSISSTAEYGAATARITYHKASLTFESPPLKQLFDGFRQFGAEGAALADKYDPNNAKPITFIGLGAMYDPGGWFVMAEWGSIDSDSVLGKRTAWYASGGYRLGKVTPYLTYAETRADSNTSDPGLNLSGLPPAQAGLAAGLNAGLNAALGSLPEQKTLSFGARWDFAKSVALKLQYDHIRLGDGSAGTLINTQPAFQSGGKVDVLSAAVDFVF